MYEKEPTVCIMYCMGTAIDDSDQKVGLTGAAQALHKWPVSAEYSLAKSVSDMEQEPCLPRGNSSPAHVTLAVIGTINDFIFLIFMHIFVNQCVLTITSIRK